MLSLRALSRVVPRAAARVAPRTAVPQLSTLRTSNLLLAQWKPTIVPALASSFHNSTAWRQGNEELVSKLEREYQMEKDISKQSEDYASSVKTYLKDCAFEIQDTEGQEEVVLTRKYGDEDIRVTFTIADLANVDEESDEIDDEALYDEEDADLELQQSGGAKAKGAANEGHAPEGSAKAASDDRAAAADFDDRVPFPARVNITIERKDKGALAIEAIAESGDIVIEQVHYFPEAELAEPKSAEKDFSRRTLYTGPPFGNLDSDLQILLERHLEERGIDTELALFIPDYIDYKEQNEYLRWLQNVKKFVE